MMTHPAHRDAPRGTLPEIPDMPGFAILVVSDVERSLRWYVDGLGFWVEKQLQGPDGLPAVIHLRRAQYRDLLLRPARDPLHGPLGQGVRLTFTCFEETWQTLQEVAERARWIGGGTVEGPLTTPWNTLDVLATDHDGYEVTISTAASATQGEWEQLKESVQSNRPPDSQGGQGGQGGQHPV